MTNTAKKTQVLAVALGVLMIMASGFAVYFEKERARWKGKADESLIQFDSLLAVKLEVEKALVNTSERHAEFEKREKELNDKLQANLLEIERLNKLINNQNNSSGQINALRKQISALQTEKGKIETQLMEATASLRQLEAENVRLKQQIVSLETENRTLKSNLDQAMFTASGSKNFLVEMRKRNIRKLTAKIKKTREISVSFSIPSSQSMAGQNITYYLSILDPNGNPISQCNQETVILQNNQSVKSCKKQRVLLSSQEQDVTMNVKLNSKIKAKGTYQIIIYSDAGISGMTKVKMN
jgi:predicted  nucleic acid-binding Zn-ribbon protein